eukprot:3696079-Prorocentrum_lima.AAC.1
MEEVVAPLLQPNGSVVAGCSLATFLAKSMLLSLLDNVQVMAPLATITSLVDDLSLHWVGQPENIFPQ